MFGCWFVACGVLLLCCGLADVLFWCAVALRICCWLLSGCSFVVLLLWFVFGSCVVLLFCRVVGFLICCCLVGLLSRLRVAVLFYVLLQPRFVIVLLCCCCYGLVLLWYFRVYVLCCCVVLLAGWFDVSVGRLVGC